MNIFACAHCFFLFFFPSDGFAYHKRVKLRLQDKKKKVYILRHYRLNFLYYGKKFERFRRNNLSEMIKLWDGRKALLYRTCQHNRVIHSTFLRAQTSLRGQREILASSNVTARRAGERESQNHSSGNPREILETDVSANESIWRTSRRQGEAPYYTPHPTPLRALRHCLLHLLFLLSPSGSSAFSAIVVVTAFYHLGRLSSPIPRS